MKQKSGVPVRTAELRMADSWNPILRVKFTDKKVGDTKEDPNSPRSYAYLSADANGSGGSKLIVLLNIGASATDYSQYQFSAYATGIADPAGVDASPTHTQCTTLGALITALNAIPGVFAARGHAPADYSLDSDDFLDIASTGLSVFPVETLYRDSSEVATAPKAWYFRLGVPDSINGKMGRGELEFIGASALVNSNSDADAVFAIYSDPDEVSTDNVKELAYTRYIPDNVWTRLWDFHEAPPVEQGPLLIKISATTTLTDGAKVLFNYRNAEL